MEPMKAKIELFAVPFLILAMYPMVGNASFVESDIELSFYSSTPTVGQGGAAVFGVTLTNHSSEDMIFNTNITHNYGSAFPTIGGENLNQSSYDAGWNIHFLYDETVLSGESYSFDYFSLQLTNDVPVDTIIDLTNVAMGFANIPPVIPNNPNGYEFVITANGFSSATVVPIPGATLLFGSALLVFAGAGRRRTLN